MSEQGRNRRWLDQHSAARQFTDDGIRYGPDGDIIEFWGLRVVLADDPEYIDVEGRDVDHTALPQEIEP